MKQAAKKNEVRFRVVNDVINAMGESFQPKASKGLKAVYQWVLSGDEPRAFAVVVNDGTFEVQQGNHESPDVTLEATSDTYLKLSNGQLKGIVAIMTRKLRVRGSLQLAQKMDAIFV